MNSETASQVRHYIETVAPPIQLASVTGNHLAPARTGRTGVLRQLNRRRAAAVAAIVVAAAAAAVAFGTTNADRSPAGLSGSAVLTAATVHRVQAASEAVTASAGHIYVAYTLGPIHQSAGSSGSIDVTYAGNNFNAVEHLPHAPGDRATQTLTIRRVNGQTYIFGGPGRAQQWYRLGSSPPAGRTVPDPRKVLAALLPEAGFKKSGSQLVGGIQTTILSATNLTGLPASVLSSLTFVSSMASAHLEAFDVSVDGHDVVRQMKTTYYFKGGQGQFMETQTISFLDIGKPEQISTPGNYVNQGTGR
ncbi:MAG: hypothetical protein J2P28_14220 [Actinobacteria bacterium]|nr:hypothetical protein [Actinomycetota bacterium]